MRAKERHRQGLVIVSLLIAFGLGVLFGALVARRPRGALAPGVAAGTDAVGELTSPPSPSPVRAEPDSVPGDGTATARDGYPIKGNGRSGIYHVPGGFAYDRTVASICFRSVEAAQAAGFRASKS